MATAFELEIVACPTPLHAKILIAWLAEQIPELHPIRPLTVSRGDPGRAISVADATREILAPLAGSRTSRPVFLDMTVAQIAEAPTWRWLFQRLNERRNEISLALQAPLVLLIPRWLEPVFPAEAPDLWSIRSVALEVPAPRAQAVPRGSARSVWTPFEDLESLHQQIVDRGRAASSGAIADRRAYAAVLRRYADTLLVLADVAKAEPLIERELTALSAAVDDPLENARALRTLAALRLLQGDPVAAQKILTTQVLPIVWSDTGERAATLLQIAKALQAEHRFDEAERLLRLEVLPCAAQHGSLLELETKLQLMMLGEADSDMVRTVRAELLPIVERISDTRWQAHGLLSIAEILSAHGESDEVLRILNEDVIPRFQQVHDAHGVAVAKLLLAGTTLKNGDDAAAFAVLQEHCLPEFERVGDLVCRWAALSLMAIALVRQGKLDDALPLMSERPSASSQP